MDIRFKDKALDQLESDASVVGSFPEAIVKAFRKRMQTIRAAPDERVFYSLKSLHFEKMEGKRAHQHSMRLNDQYRLVLEFEGDSPNKVVVVIGVEDYH